MRLPRLCRRELAPRGSAAGEGQQPATPALAARSGVVCIAGRPNAGKSTLLNHLVGQKISIVSSRPQTTRNRILGILTEERGQLLFIDTPGIHRPYHQMNQRMARLVEESLRRADLLLHLIDVSIAFGAGERKAMEMVSRTGQTAFLVLNKIDRIEKNLLLPRIDLYRRLGSYAEFLPISARTGENVDMLLREILRYLPPGDPMFSADHVTDLPERFVVAEFIREQVSEQTRQEVPHCSAVLIDRFDESDRDRNQVRIAATIVVEKESHKKIIIGKGGAGIKAIGTRARREIELLLGCSVYLELFVKVVEKWRDQDRFLDTLGP
ncbi:MAG: GTPase Era [Acidobacteria bacterium]|nr:GTPase Era [Acidobacteriota bacterium]